MKYFILDVDECTDGDHDCNANAKCDNTVGSFNCTCNGGYSGDGVTCAGIENGQFTPKPRLTESEGSLNGSPPQTNLPSFAKTL